MGLRRPVGHAGDGSLALPWVGTALHESGSAAHVGIWQSGMRSYLRGSYEKRQTLFSFDYAASGSGGSMGLTLEQAMRYSIVGVTAKEVQTIGGKNIRESPRTGIIFADLTPEQVERLKAIGAKVSEVGKVEPMVMPPAPVAAVPIYTSQQVVAAIGVEQLRSLTEPPLYGEDMTVAIIDSGVRETHEKIKGRVVYSKNFTADPMRDGFDHGTGVVSMVLAVAPRVNIVNLKVLDDKGAGSEEDVVMAIEEVLALHDRKSEIAPWGINLSLGSPDTGEPYSALRVACRVAIGRGIWVGAAAGNSGPTPRTIMSPACERYVIAIGSAKLEPFAVSEFSSRGPTREGLIKPDCLLIGENILLASSTSDTAEVAKSGTSFSLPLSGGITTLFQEALLRRARLVHEPIGIYEEFERLFELGEAPNPQEVIDYYLPRLCVKPQATARGKDNDYGWGLFWAPALRQAFAPVGPAVDISSMIMPLLAMSMMGMFIPIVLKEED